MTKRYFLLLMSCLLMSLSALAQTGMTDDQVMRFILKEREAGTVNTQIVRKLVQRGVNIDQIRRVRKKAERLQNEEGLGALSNETNTNGQSRLRQNNAEKRGVGSEERGVRNAQSANKDDGLYHSQYRTSEIRHRYDNSALMQDDEYLFMMEDELNTLLPDTAALLQQLLAEREQLRHKRQVFGRDMFSKENLTFEPAMNIATPQNYRLGPGDVVFIEVYGASQKTIEGTISPDGEVTIEDFGPISLAGLTVEQANARLRSTLGARYQSSSVKLTVGQTRSIIVNIYGEVEAPGTYTLSAFSTVFNALYMAGGVNDIGTLRSIKVYRNSQLIANVDAYDFIMNGNLRSNVRLADNDVIVVGAYDCLVNISGKVKRPMYYEMKKNESLQTLLRYAGGFTGDAYTKQLRVVRKTGREYSIHNVEEFDWSTFRVNDEDSVSVDSVLNRFSNMAEVRGAVFRPGMYQVGGSISSVKALIENAEGLREEAFTAHAVMHRMKEDRTLEVVQVDVDGILNGTVADIPLKPNDVLFIPTKQDLMEQQTLTIDGEVHYPGIYQYAANETLEDLILQAGGLKNSASTVKVDVSRRITNPKAFTTDSLTAHTFSFALKDGFVIDGEPGFTLLPFDQVYVRKSPGSYEQQNITVEGEVMFAGTYTLPKKDARLSDIIRSAGGVNDRAYTHGARLERRYNDVERMAAEEARNKAREEFELMQIELATSTNNANLANIKTTQQQKKYEVLETYPVAIELDKALAQPGCDEDIILREGDRLIVPQYNATVKINGEVMYPNSVSYRKGKSVSYYIDQAGGFTNKAKKSRTYIKYMNGHIAKVGHDAKPEPGCEIVVPQKSLTKMTVAEKLAIGTGVISVGTLIATLANILK